MLKPETRRLIVIAIILLTVIVAVYAQVGSHQFITLDDDAYVTDNPHIAAGLTGSTVLWAFTTVDYFYWQPLTWLSHMTDIHLYGMNPRGHHLTNVVLHLLCSLGLLLLFVRLTGKVWQSSFVAFLFALHPQSVESVAWVAERKDVLSALFWCLTLFVYVEYTLKRTRSLYIVSLGLFVLGLMAKPMIVTLPVIMLLLDFWPLGRMQSEKPTIPLRERIMEIRPLLLEKVPFVMLSLVSAVVTMYGNSQAGGMRTLEELPLLLRLENAVVSYVAYIGKALLPLNLALFYPFPVAVPLWKVVGSLVVLLLVTAFVIRQKAEKPYLMVGWFWFLVTLLPVSGLFQSGEQAMADRFSYIPRVGLLLMAAWGFTALAQKGKRRKLILAGAAGAVLIVATVLTWQQLGYWRDSISLYRRTLQLTTGNYTIHNNLGLALAEQGDLQGAIQEYRDALKIRTDKPFIHNNLGMALAKQGFYDDAIAAYRQALLLSPGYANAYNNLGMALAGQGNLDGALQNYRQALGINPDNADAYYNMGLAFARKGDFNSAISAYRQALRITPSDLDAHLNLGTAYAGMGQLDLAIGKFQEVLLMDPANLSAQNNLQIALTQKRMQERMDSFRHPGQ